LRVDATLVEGIRANSLDHVALWVSERERIARFCCEHLAMHEITTGDDFTLLGVDAHQGKLTLFDAEGEREPGALERIVLRVAEPDAALAALPPEANARRAGEGYAFDAPGGIGMGLTRGEGRDYDLDHVVLRVSDPERTASALAELGFERRDGTLVIADRSVRLEPGGAAEPERPLLNHLALLVDSMERVRAEALERGLGIEKVVDAENTIAVFVRGPDGIVVEYVEHKPEFSLV
jgi:catechol 2,3-dioxygenase-like lactoylglutathione lyase family enzyme